MKSFTFAAVAASLLLGVCLFVTGCGRSSTGSEKMGMSDGTMSAMDTMSVGKMSDDKMSDGNMSAMDTMSDGKMSDGKMGDEKMSGK